MAFVVFLIVKWINKLKRPTEQATPTTKSANIATQISILKQQSAPTVLLIRIVRHHGLYGLCIR